MCFENTTIQFLIVTRVAKLFFQSFEREHNRKRVYGFDVGTHDCSVKNRTNFQFSGPRVFGEAYVKYGIESSQKYRRDRAEKSVGHLIENQSEYIYIYV